MLVAGSAVARDEGCGGGAEEVEEVECECFECGSGSETSKCGGRCGGAADECSVNEG